MRVRISARPTVECIDGVQLDRFQQGAEYEVGSQLAELLIVEGWAEPIGFDASPRSWASPARSAAPNRVERRANVIRVGRR
jgi:hypothetical protein